MKYQLMLNPETQLTLVTGFGGKFTTFINGTQVEQKNGQYNIPVDNETKLLTIKRGMIENIPKVTFDGKRLHLVKKLKAYEWGISCLSLLLVFIGGALGGVIGAIGLLFSAKVFRTELPQAVKILFSIVISILAAGLYFVIASLLLSALEGTL
ncbi:MAG: hypothetical protein ACE3L7_06225 [Candidatus Pristimantibacillus sp.]